MANKNLTAAKAAKNDEFYTELPEIQAELSNYTDKFQGKVVFCNCDDPFESNFVKYFLMNFNRLGLKELIATGYQTSPITGTELPIAEIPYSLRVTETKQYLVGTQTDLDVAGAKYFIATEKGLRSLLRGNYSPDGSVFYEAGDFRSDMCVELLKQSDIVVTNPPFSLFREYVAQLMKYKKQFLILGNMNAITYKEFFPLLKENKVWLGCRSGSKEYITSKTYAAENPAKVYARDGHYYIKMGNTGWFTNLDHAKRHQMIPLDLGYTYYGNEDMYPKYDNYNAINVDKVSQIPCDYDGVMGVPISFLDKYCPEQFEIVGLTTGREDFTPESNPTKRYVNAIQHNMDGTETAGSKANTRACIRTDIPTGIYYTADNARYPLSICYARILIRRG